MPAQQTLMLLLLLLLRWPQLLQHPVSPLCLLLPQASQQRLCSK